MTGIKMFCGELRGQLEPCHIGFRADEVRRSIAMLFNEGQGNSKWWPDAKREGWRVVPVEVRALKTQ